MTNLNRIDPPEGSSESAGTLGTFAGVFTPSILTILGIILFLRLGFVVGNAGLAGSLIIIGIATVVSVLTSVSLAAIATNIDVKAGGDYYMISRTLGIEFGGAIGLVLFLAQSVSIAFYAIGFGEAVGAMLGVDGGVVPRLLAGLAIAGLFILAWQGADVAAKFQFVVMALLVAALGSFYLGATAGFDSGLAGDNLSAPSGGLGFWVVFAIFFPAVTGFTQGVSLSGDLKDPGKSLPRGTFAAVGLSTVVYLTIAVLFAGNADSRTLIEDTGAMGSIAAFGPLIDAGVLAATLSSAMASFLGAPRILQSLAVDRVFPRLEFFAKGHGPTANPRRGVLLALVIALVTIVLGDLDVIAPVVSMFFLISYGLLNYATYYEARAKSPSFRPRFRFFNKRLSLLGALACLGTMLAINPVSGAAAAVVMFGIYRYLGSRKRPERWVDSTHAHHFQRAMESIDAMTEKPDHARSWRPQILAFSADPERRRRLLEFGSWLEGDSGLTATIHIVVGTGAVKRRERRQAQAALASQIEELGIDVHGRAVLAAHAGEALPVIIQSFGMGPLAANTVLFGWPENSRPDQLEAFFETVRDVMRLGINTVVLSSGDRAWRDLETVRVRKRRIDVWFETDDDASRLALLSAYLFTRTPYWGRAKIRVLGDASVAGGAATERILRQVVEEARIPAEVKAIWVSDESTITSESSESAVVFLPMKLRRDGQVGPFGTDLDRLVEDLALTASVLAAETFDLGAAPESGGPALLAAAEERVSKTRSRLQTLESDQNEAEADLERLERATEPLTAEDEARRDEVAQRVAQLRRRILAARVRLTEAENELAAIIEAGIGTAGNGA
jgi:amino acid transporter